MANDTPGGKRALRGERAESRDTIGLPTVAGKPAGAEFRITEFAPLESRFGPPSPQPPPPTLGGGSQFANTANRPREIHRESPTRSMLADEDSWFERLIARPLPLIGGRSVTQQVQGLAVLMLVSFLFTVVVVFVDLRNSANNALQISIIGNALMNTQRLAKAAPNAVAGTQSGFAQLIDSRDQIDLDLSALVNGDPSRNLSPPSAEAQGPIARLRERWRASQSAASVIAARQRVLVAFGDIIHKIDEASPRLDQLAGEIQGRKMRTSASPREIAAAGQLLTLNQRIARGAAEMSEGRDAGPDAAQRLGRDVGQFRELAQGLLSGSEILGLSPTTDPDTRNSLQELVTTYSALQASIGGLAGALEPMVKVREAESVILAESEPLLEEVGKIQDQFNAERHARVIDYWMMTIFAFIALASMLAIVKVLLADTTARAKEAEAGQVEALNLEEDAKRSNEQAQAAILRLMNELQEVADGNLTVQATVTEDVTGAIADSVNYTVEELRTLVGRINSTAEQVNTSSTQARDIATRLLTSSEAQSKEIRETGEKVLSMASQINDASRSAGDSASVARASLDAAERGQRAVYNQISGMNEIREQIQETAKRIKRLGESSQEIGEITDLISDITEQTNVLALNAAIQAASAGEAGRGFSVVAEEVQRLADRSAQAAKQIGALVRTIQTDTQDAVSAMEKSTQGVVEGTKLSDAAGTALAEIGRVSRRLAELIEGIARSTSEQAHSAGGVAHSIEHILTVTDQTSQGTRQAAQSIGQLATLARELKASVARFRVN